MLGKFETSLLGDAVLTFFNFIIKKLFHQPAIQTHQVIMMRALVELEDGLAGFKMVATEQPGLLKLREYPVNGCQTDIKILGKKELVDILGRQVSHRAALEDLKDF